MSDYRLQITHASTGQVVVWTPGHDMEPDLVDELSSRLARRGVGWFTSEAKVLTALREEFASMLFDLKRKVR